MSTKAISTEDLSKTLHLSECRDGFWLYDDTRGMNLAMRAKTKDEALVDALDYYQSRLKEVETEYKLLKDKVDSFVNQFNEDDD